ncbi:MAG: hypothetical protein WC504_16065 [Methylobacter sp.]
MISAAKLPGEQCSSNGQPNFGQKKASDPLGFTGFRLSGQLVFFIKYFKSLVSVKAHSCILSNTQQHFSLSICCASFPSPSVKIGAGRGLQRLTDEEQWLLKTGAAIAAIGYGRYRGLVVHARDVRWHLAVPFDS